jgi:hypothetical protein
LKLIENDYRILRSFEGLASLGTYLTTVIARLFLDFQIHEWGRWRPSAAATRLGPFQNGARKAFITTTRTGSGAGYDETADDRIVFGV